MYKRIYFLFGLIFLVLVTAIFLHRTSLVELDRSISYVEHTYEVIGSLNEISGDLKSAQLHTYAVANNGDNNLLANDFVDLITDLNRLKPIIFDSSQEKRVDTLALMINNWREVIAESNNSDLLNPETQKAINSKASEIQRVINRSAARQRELLTDRDELLKATVKALHRWTMVLIALAFLLIVFTTVYAYMQMKNRIDLEVLLESILNASQEGIITCKTCREGFKIEDFEILFANSAVKTHLNIEPSELVGKSILYIMPEIQTSGLFSKWIQVVEDGMPDEYEACHKDPATYKENWYSVKLVKLDDGVTVTFHNITELRSFKQNLIIN